MKKENLTYKKLLDEGKITLEQYNELRLSKITVGLGYSNIKGSFETLELDDEITHPLSYDEPVKLSREFYTSDSNNQYILEHVNDTNPITGESLTLYHDDYLEYTDFNFTTKLLNRLKNLETTTKGYNDYFNISFMLNSDSNLVTKIANNYDLNPDTTRIICHANFAIIYEVNDNKITIGDLLYNFKIDNKDQQMNITNIVLMQIKLAFDQINNGKDIDISRLNKNQQEIYKKIIKLDEELDIERGIKHAK